MTHASRTHDIFARVEEAEAELALLLADIASVMRDVEPRNLSEGKRLRWNGVKRRLDQARGLSP